MAARTPPDTGCGCVLCGALMVIPCMPATLPWYAASWQILQALRCACPGCSQGRIPCAACHSTTTSCQCSRLWLLSKRYCSAERCACMHACMRYGRVLGTMMLPMMRCAGSAMAHGFPCAGGVRLEPSLSFSWGTQGPPFPSGFNYSYFSMRITFYFQARRGGGRGWGGGESKGIHACMYSCISCMCIAAKGHTVNGGLLIAECCVSWTA